jgi:hypothetical protein
MKFISAAFFKFPLRGLLKWTYRSFTPHPAPSFPHPRHYILESPKTQSRTDKYLVISSSPGSQKKVKEEKKMIKWQRAPRQLSKFSHVVYLWDRQSHVREWDIVEITHRASNYRLLPRGPQAF